MTNKLRLKRHESFYLREGWMEKALVILQNQNVSFSKVEGIKTFGIGSNMVKSLRYWLIATGLLDDKNNALTELANTIIKFDLYLDELFTWWILHINLTSNYEDAPVFNLLFNFPRLKNFTTASLVDLILDYMKENEIDMSNASLVKDDVSVFVRSYCDQKSADPEDNLNCPFGKLCLMREDKKGINFVQASSKKLPAMAVYYSIQKFLKQEKTDSINIDDLISADDSPTKILNMDKNLFYAYLNELQVADLITINRTAGLNMIYLNKTLSLDEIFERQFGGNI